MIKWLLAFKSYVHFFLSPLSPSKREGYMKKKRKKKKKKRKKSSKGSKLNYLKLNPELQKVPIEILNYLNRFNSHFKWIPIN